MTCDGGKSGAGCSCEKSTQPHASTPAGRQQQKHRRSAREHRPADFDLVAGLIALIESEGGVASAAESLRRVMAGAEGAGAAAGVAVNLCASVVACEEVRARERARERAEGEREKAEARERARRASAQGVQRAELVAGARWGEVRAALVGLLAGVIESGGGGEGEGEGGESERARGAGLARWRELVQAVETRAGLVESERAWWSRRARTERDRARRREQKRRRRERARAERDREIERLAAECAAECAAAETAQKKAPPAQ